MPIHARLIPEMINKKHASSLGNFGFNFTKVPKAFSKNGKDSRYSLVLNTAGSTVEKDAEASKKYSREVNLLIST
jgi:hypothetical protein